MNLHRCVQQKERIKQDLTVSLLISCQAKLSQQRRDMLKSLGILDNTNGKSLSNQICVITVIRFIHCSSGCETKWFIMSNVIINWHFQLQSWTLYWTILSMTHIKRNKYSPCSKTIRARINHSIRKWQYLDIMLLLHCVIIKLWEAGYMRILLVILVWILNTIVPRCITLTKVSWEMLQMQVNDPFTNIVLYTVVEFWCIFHNWNSVTSTYVMCELTLRNRRGLLVVTYRAVGYFEWYSLLADYRLL